MPAILAHGALGPFDELVFIGIAVVFLMMMGLSWARSQQMPADEIEGEDAAQDRELEQFELE